MRRNGRSHGAAEGRVLAWTGAALAALAILFVLLRPSLPEPEVSGGDSTDTGTVYSKLDLAEQYPELAEIGKWLARFVGPETVIYADERVSVRAAGARYRPVPKGSYEDVLDTIVREKGDFLILQQKIAGSASPELVPLTIDMGAFWNEPRLSPVRLLPGRSGNTVAFRVVRPGGPDSVRTERLMLARTRFMQHPPKHVWHGSLAMRKGRYDVAQEEFGLALKSDSTNVGLMNKRAFALLKADWGLDTAEELARTAVASDPKNPEFLETLAGVLAAEGKSAEADALRQKLKGLKKGGDDR